MFNIFRINLFDPDKPRGSSDGTSGTIHTLNGHMSMILTPILVEQPTVTTAIEELHRLLSPSTQVPKVVKILTDAMHQAKNLSPGGSLLVDFIGQLFGTAELPDTEQHISIVTQTLKDKSVRRVFAMMLKEVKKQSIKVTMVLLPDGPGALWNMIDYRVLTLLHKLF